MSELLTAAQMRAIEQAAIASGEVTGLELMERAGRGVVAAVFEEWPELSRDSCRALVLCGPGNNGGDGFVVARLLKQWGWAVEVYLYGDPERLPPDAKVNYRRWLELGEVEPLEDERFDGWPNDGSGIALIVDALFGTGLTRPFLDCHHLRKSVKPQGPGWPRVVAVDVPSGLCADSGKWLVDSAPLDNTISANLTVTFHMEKLGHRLAHGPASCGQLVIKTIGLDGREPGEEGGDRPQAEAKRPATGVVGRCPAVPPGGASLVDVPASDRIGKSTTAHKYSHGHALILCGGAGHTGAARLAARGALRIGAGLVTLGVPGAAQMEVAAQVTAPMLRRLDGAEALAELLEDARFNALCLGPGLGIERARDLVPVALGNPARSVVLDADALTAFADAPETLFAMLHKACVLTPHGGEFARLFPDIAEKLNANPTKGPAYSKVDATRAAAARAGCVVLYKGPDTVIAKPDGRCAVNSAHYDRAAPWLATAGAGDVLAGFITGLLARGSSALMAAETAAWLHVECARSFGPGLIAEDLPEELPKVLRALGV